MVDAYVVGTGMVGAQQLTREALTALRRSGLVYVLHPQDAFKRYLAVEFDAEVESLSGVYRENRERIAIYEEVAATVIESARDAGEPVALALYGHPMVGVTPSRLIRERATAAGLAVEFVPGVSSLGCLFVDLGIDPFDGLQLFEATGLLESGSDPDSGVPMLLFQVGSVGRFEHTAEGVAAGGLARLVDYLTEHYPSDHGVTLARSATYPFAVADLTEVRLGSLTSVADRVTKMHSLYVPAVDADGAAEDGSPGGER